MPKASAMLLGKTAWGQSGGDRTSSTSGGTRTIFGLPPGIIRVFIGCLTATVILLPVIVRGGWPFNHDVLMDFSRLSAFVGQWKLGHLIPVWSTTEQWGFGSPAPAMYNKSFFYVASGVLALTGSPKAAVTLGLGVFMVVGFTGAASAVRHALPRRDLLAESTAGILVVSCNYATTDWLVRGACSDFAALACTTWVFAWCIKLVMQGEWSLWVGPALAAVTLGHVTLGLYNLLPLTLGVIAAVLVWRRRCLRWVGPAIGSIAVFAAIVLPFELPLVILDRWANVGALSVYTPRATHLAFARLWWDTKWIFGQRWTGLSIQLDLVLLGGMAVLAVLAALKVLGSGWHVVFDRTTVVVAFLVAVVGVVIFLQSWSGVRVFDSVPVLNVIQFSWRLLTFLSVAVAIGCGMLIGVMNAHGARALRLGASSIAVLLIASTVTNKPWWSGMHYGWFSAEAVAESLHGSVIAGGEYLPRITATATGAPDNPPDPLRNIWQPSIDTSGTPCRVTREGRQDREQAAIQFGLHCSASGEAVLPIFDAPGMSVSVEHDGRVTVVPHFRECADARLRLRVEQGQSTVSVETPHWLSLVGGLLRGGGFDYERSCASRR